jgi:hypothetical protein
VPDVVACIAATARVELDCCSTTILEVWPIIEVMRFTFLVIAMFKALRTSIFSRINLSGMVSGHVGGAVVNCIVCTFVCVFHSCHRFLTRRGLVTTVSWKIRGLSAKRARSICGVHLLVGAVKEDYGAGSKMGHVTCRPVLPGVGSMGSPEWSVPCVRTG